jgi:sterol 3beta-glucosyltransferase
MSTIVILAVGSRGDVAPLTGVGVRLQQAGHRVVIVAYSPFAELITGCGLGFRQLGDAVDVNADLADVNPIKGVSAFFTPNGMRSFGKQVIAALGDESPDILLVSPLAELVGHPLAEAAGVPSIGVRLQPLSATAAYPPAVLGAWSAGRAGNRLASHTGAWLLDRLYGGVIGGIRRELGLPKVSSRALRRRRTESNWPVLHGYSPTVLPRPADWRPGLEVVGYWWPAAVEWQPPDALTDFLAAGPPPVLVSFGSTVNTAERAQQMSDIVARALRQAGARGIVQAGWAGLEVAGADMLAIGDAPHDWLFPRVAVAAHHCGAGTTAAALRAGVPAIGMPGLGDQSFWARRLEQLGVSPTTVPQRKLDADRLASAIGTAIDATAFRNAARRVARSIGDEDGAARVVATVESLVRTS